MATVQVPYGDIGRAALTVGDTLNYNELVTGDTPKIKTVAMDVPVSTAFEPFSVIGFTGANVIAMATRTYAPGYRARQVLTFSGVGTAADTITIGSTVYTLRAAPTTVAGEVKIGGTADATAQNLMNAINAGAGAGTNYGSLTVEHPDVRAHMNASGVLEVVAKVEGVAGNAIATTESGTNTSFAAATMTGGLDSDGVRPRGVLFSRVNSSVNAQKAPVALGGCFNPDALVWDSSFVTADHKRLAFFGAPTPTDILIKPIVG